LTHIKTYHFYSVGDNAITICFGNAIDDGINQQVQRAYDNLKENSSKGWLDIIPSYTTITVIFHLNYYRNQKIPIADFVKREIIDGLGDGNIFLRAHQRIIEVPVCFDIPFALDRSKLEFFAKLSFDKILKLFLSRTYTVYMLGFLPGFPYMAKVSAQIAAPRFSSPRKLVEAGSVGIAGEQTGIYPLSSPGGWNIIGKTPLKIVDVNVNNPVFFRPGDLVKFYPITPTEFSAFDQSEFNTAAQ
jgi:inhibitor of KinA